MYPPVIKNEAGITITTSAAQKLDCEAEIVKYSCAKFLIGMATELSLPPT